VVRNRPSEERDVSRALTESPTLSSARGVTTRSARSATVVLDVRQSNQRLRSLRAQPPYEFIGSSSTNLIHTAGAAAVSFNLFAMCRDTRSQPNVFVHEFAITTIAGLADEYYNNL